jgi:hypothetical protein
MPFKYIPLTFFEENVFTYKGRNGKENKFIPYVDPEFLINFNVGSVLSEPLLSITDPNTNEKTLIDARQHIKGTPYNYLSNSNSHSVTGMQYSSSTGFVAKDSDDDARNATFDDAKKQLKSYSDEEKIEFLRFSVANLQSVYISAAKIQSMVGTSDPLKTLEALAGNVAKSAKTLNALMGNGNIMDNELYNNFAI